MLRIRTILIIGFFTVSTSVAGLFERANNFGARNMGMGGAGIANVSNSMAIYYNPAELSKIEKFVFDYGNTISIANQDYVTPTGIQEENLLAPAVIPFVGFAGKIYQPEILGEKRPFYAGLAFYAPTGVAWKFPSFSSFNTGTVDSASNASAVESSLFVLELSPALTWKVFPFMSIGGTVRGDYMKGHKVAHYSPLAVERVAETDNEDISLGWRFGISLFPGEVWDTLKDLTLGTVYRSETNFFLRGAVVARGGAAVGAGTNVSADYSSGEFTIPRNLGFGASYQLFDNLALAADLIWFDHSAVHDLIETYSNAGPTGARNYVIRIDGSDNYNLHVGAEYNLNKKVSLRSGYALDSVASPKWVMNRVGLHANVHIISIGTGYNWGKIRTDSSYEIAFGHIEVPNDGVSLNPGRYDAQVHGLSFSIHYAP